MKTNETKTTRIPKWVYKLFSEKAKTDDISFIKKIDEVAESLKLLNENEVILDRFLDKAYKEDDTNTPRFVYEALSALMHYWDGLNGKDFNKYSFRQFIDRWNVVAYYISAHIYTNVLPISNLNDDELLRRAESTTALAFLFTERTEEVIECINKMCKSIDPYKNAYICKESKAFILSKIFENEQLMNYIENDNIIRRENAICDLFTSLDNRYDLKSEGKSIYDLFTIKSTGLTNKIAYLVYKNYNDGKIYDLPYFVNEDFINDIFSLLHNCYLHDYTSDLYYVKPLEAAFKITQAVMTLNRHKLKDEYYLKSNLENTNNYNNLEDALKADIEGLSQRNYTYSAEMRMRTPMQIIDLTTKEGIKFVHRHDIKKVIIENIVHMLNPLYHLDIKTHGKILKFRNENYINTNIYSDDKKAQITINMTEESYYSCFILYINDDKDLEATSTYYVKHDSLEKIYHKINREDINTTKIEKDFKFYINKDVIQITHNQGSIYLYGTMLKSFIEVINKYIKSENFIKNKKLDILNNGIL